MENIFFEEENNLIGDELWAEHTKGEPLSLEDCNKMIADINKKIEKIVSHRDCIKNEIELDISKFRYHDLKNDTEASNRISKNIISNIKRLKEIDCRDYDRLISERDEINKVRDKILRDDYTWESSDFSMDYN
jgi:hypothetical protein